MKYVDADIGKPCFWIAVVVIAVTVLLYWVSLYE